MATDHTQEQLAEYYKLNVSQLRWSFGSSLAALFAGLAALLAGVGLVLAGNSGLASQLVVLGGVLTEFIAAGFFLLYSRNLKQLNGNRGQITINPHRRAAGTARRWHDLTRLATDKDFITPPPRAAENPG
jgi:hypothetical protein